MVSYEASRSHVAGTHLSCAFWLEQSPKTTRVFCVKSQYFPPDIYALLLVGPVLWSEYLRIYIHIIYTNMDKYREIRGLSHCSYFSPVVFVYIRFSGGVLFWFCHPHLKLQTNLLIKKNQREKWREILFNSEFRVFSWRIASDIHRKHDLSLENSISERNCLKIFSVFHF